MRIIKRFSTTFPVVNDNEGEYVRWESIEGIFCEAYRQGVIAVMEGNKCGYRQAWEDYCKAQKEAWQAAREGK